MKGQTLIFPIITDKNWSNVVLCSSFILVVLDECIPLLFIVLKKNGILNLMLARIAGLVYVFVVDIMYLCD